MKIKDFKTHTISRSDPPHKSRYKQYKPYLKEDFCGRCAYCNLLDESITTSFEVDHFIPRDAFKNDRLDLDTDYKNLVYACKKCNGAKLDQFEGDIRAPSPTNELFYDPVLVDYNDIFYRNHLGAIDSDDEKGRQQIVRLKLYRPIHILAWVCEQMRQTADKLERAIDVEQNAERKDKLQEALNKIDRQGWKLFRLFIAVYNDNSFTISGTEDAD